jgi:hypothetical protein
VQFLPAVLGFYSFRVASGLPLFTIYFFGKDDIFISTNSSRCAKQQTVMTIWTYRGPLAEIGRKVNFRWTFNLILDFTVIHI